MREFDIKIGRILFRFQSGMDLEVETELQRFLVEKKEKPDVSVIVGLDYETARKPITEPVGEDLLQKYYREKELRFCVTKGGVKGPVGLACYETERQRIHCVLNGRDYKLANVTLGWVLRLLPMREIFQQFGVLFFHSAQIAVGNRGILFTAPSETGKSTQATLWETYEQARILCGDRTLVAKSDGVWKCFGYPVDGSSPIRTTEETELRAIVFLTQASENRVERLKPIGAVAKLMQQLIIDTWSADARQKGVEALLNIQQSIPVYQLFCTPDRRAVDVLKKQLIEDGMIE